MKCEALSWYKWMCQNNQLNDWDSFARAMELRFGPSTYENHQAQLFKLRQTGSIADYQSSFEKLGNRVLGLPQEALLNCFISGLIPKIRHELAIRRPYSISQAIGLAKLIEAKIKDMRPKFSRPFAPSPSPTTNPHTVTTKGNIPTTSNPKPTNIVDLAFSNLVLWFCSACNLFGNKLCIVALLLSFPNDSLAHSRFFAGSVTWLMNWNYLQLLESILWFMSRSYVHTLAPILSLISRTYHQIYKRVLLKK